MCRQHDTTLSILSVAPRSRAVSRQSGGRLRGGADGLLLWCSVADWSVVRGQNVASDVRVITEGTSWAVEAWQYVTSINVRQLHRSPVTSVSHTGSYCRQQWLVADSDHVSPVTRYNGVFFRKWNFWSETSESNLLVLRGSVIEPPCGYNEKTGDVGVTWRWAVSCIHWCSGKAINSTYCECVFVALGI